MAERFHRIARRLIDSRDAAKRPRLIDAFSELLEGPLAQVKELLLVAAIPPEYDFREATRPVEESQWEELRRISKAHEGEAWSWSPNSGSTGEVVSLRTLSTAGMAAPIRVVTLPELSGHLFALGDAELGTACEDHIREMANVLSIVIYTRWMQAGSARRTAFLVHGLMGPTQGISSLARALADRVLEESDGRVSKDIESMLDQIQAEANHLRLWSDVARYMPIALREREISLRKKLQPVDRVLKRWLRQYRPNFKERNIELRFSTPRGLPILCEFDDRALGIVISNLLDNASKYSLADTRVNVSASAGKTHVSIGVENSTVFPPEESARIYSLGSRGRDAVLTGIERYGHGIGLYMSREIVEAHGGRISHTVRKETGSTKKGAHRVRFTVELPLSGDSEL